MPRTLGILPLALCALFATGSATGCAGAPAPRVSVSRPTAGGVHPRSSDGVAAGSTAEPPPPAPAPEHWYFEWLSHDGKRALLRRLDAEARATMQTRVVDVDSGATLQEETFAELGKVPFASFGRKAPDLAEEIDDVLAAPAFGDDLVRGARLAGVFPFGSFGRLSTSSSGAIAFNAGDWVYVADKVGRVRKRLTREVAYDPRFTPDGKHLLFRRATGMVDKVFARYELFVVPVDLSSPPRVLSGTAGARDRFSVDPDGRFAFAVASQEPHIKTCVLSIGLRPPFPVKRLACLDGGEQLVESVVSPRAKWAALTTHVKDSAVPVAWRHRVVSLTTGKVVLDRPTEPGMMIRAISDGGLLVQSGFTGAVVDDVQTKKRHSLGDSIELGHRGFFRSATELVVVRGSSVGVVDVADAADRPKSGGAPRSGVASAATATN